MNRQLDKLLQHPGIWRGERSASTERHSLSSGFPDLDALMPGGGWPGNALTEILVPHPGIGELRLVIPALAELTRQGRWLAWVAPPYIPYPPALAACGLDLSRLLLIRPDSANDALWAVEQTLRSGTCGAVLAWPETADQRIQRRLQLAAEAGNCMAVLFSAEHSATGGSHAALRLRLEASAQGLVVHILKRRGGWACKPLRLKLDVHHPVESAQKKPAQTPEARRQT